MLSRLPHFEITFLKLNRMKSFAVAVRLRLSSSCHKCIPPVSGTFGDKGTGVFGRNTEELFILFLKRHPSLINLISKVYWYSKDRFSVLSNRLSFLYKFRDLILLLSLILRLCASVDNAVMWLLFDTCLFFINQHVLI